jgi:aspartate ammonia-lyase
VYDIAVTERQLLSQAKWDEIFTFENLIRPHFIQ